LLLAVAYPLQLQAWCQGCAALGSDRLEWPHQ